MKNALLILTLFSTLLIAQNASVYTRYALGDYAPYFSAKNVVLGDASALADNEHVGSSNPAAWSAVNLTRVEGGFMLTQSLQEEGNLSAKHFGAKFLGIRFAVPFQRDYGVVFALFLEPVTVIDYDVQKRYINEQFDNYNLHYKGSGGISKIGFGLTYRFPFGLAIGSTFDYYSGNSYYSSTIDFNDFSQYKDATFKLNQAYRGLGFTPGIITNDFAELFDLGKISSLTFSASVRFIARVHIDTAMTIHSKYDEITTPGSSYIAEIPNTYTFGMKLELNKTVMFLADYSLAKWSEFQKDAVREANVNDRFKFTLGIEYLDKLHKQRTFWQKVPLRLGFSYEKLQYTVEGKNIYALVGSFGFGLPMNEADRVDFAVSFGKRGPTDETLVQEKFVSFGVSLSFGEQWFVRRGYK
jgi:hypothetical protein